MTKIWKIIKPSKNLTVKQCINDLKKNRNYYISPWIEDIINNKKNKIKATKEEVKLIKVSVRSLGFRRATTLKKIYQKIKKNKYALVPPDIAIRARFFYNEQKTGEWLRFATPFNSMIDIDGVPHLPKLGKALGKFFIETYWSYPKAIFHPHNIFIVVKK